MIIFINATFNYFYTMELKRGSHKEFRDYCDIYAEALGKQMFMIKIMSEYYICDKGFLKNRNQKIYYASKAFDNSSDAELSRKLRKRSKKPRNKNPQGNSVCAKSIIEGVGANNYRRWMSEVSRFIEGEQFP